MLRLSLLSRAALLASAVLVGVLLGSGSAAAADYYVAKAGSDQNSGSLAEPFASLQKGHDVAAAGDTVWLRGGSYPVGKQIKLSKSGQSDAQRIRFWAYPGETPILDFASYVSTNTAADVPALLLTGSWLHLKGFEVANVPVGASGDHSISAVRSEGASNNTFELLNIHHNFGPGLFISKGTGGNLLLNLDSHDNYDKDGSQGDGQNGDGFGVHYQESGPSTIIRGCRAWLNSDDGYDFISQEVPVITEGSWAVMNGYSDGGSGKPSSGNGNGFKAGSSKSGIRHVLQNNLAWKNRAAGFYANHSSGGNTWLNNTSYMNAVQYNMLASPPDDPNTSILLAGALAHKLRNNVGFPNKNTNMGGVDSQFNTWDLGLTEASATFVSVSDAGYTGPRQPDGSLPALDFLKLPPDSPLVDQGTRVGLPFVAGAPDLGAYEHGAVVGVGSGGLGVSGGAGGTTSAMGAGLGGAGGSVGTGSGGGLLATGGAGVATAPSVNAGANGLVAGADPSGGEPGPGCACATGLSSRRSEPAPFLFACALGLMSIGRRRSRA